MVLCVLFFTFLYYTKFHIHSKIKVDVIFIIFSSPGNELRRNAIRNTWLKEIPDNALCLFAIGKVDTQYEQSLDVENYSHNDLLLLDFVDEYASLTQKLLRSIHHVVQKYDFKYLFKGDDDTYIHLKPFLSLLSRQSRRRLYWGYFVGNARVKAKGKWEENSWFLCDRYLPYARGGGYVISYDIANFISVNRDLLDSYLSEDVSMGVWLSALKVERRHERKFNTEFRSRGCNNHYLVAHKTSVDQMHRYSQNIRESGNLCSKEFKRWPSYEYNWNVPASLCCAKINQSDFY